MQISCQKMFGTRFAVGAQMFTRKTTPPLGGFLPGRVPPYRGMGSIPYNSIPTYYSIDNYTMGGSFIILCIYGEL